MKMTIRGENAVLTIGELIDSLCADDVKIAFERALRERGEALNNKFHKTQMQTNLAAHEAELLVRIADALKAIPNLGV